MESGAFNVKDIPGWGVDIDLENDPTYPMRDVSQDDHAGTGWVRPTLQEATVEVLRSTERPSLSAVFGTSVPPSGLSGVLRRWAFKKSEGKWGHWLILMGADRINVIEGIFQDFGRGRFPDFYAERGLRSESRQPRPQIYRRATWTLLAVVVVAGMYRAIR